TIIKDVNPEPDATDFSFTTSANLGVAGNNFLLDDDADATLSDTRDFNNLAAGLTYTVTEDGEAGYALTALSCTGLDANDSSSALTGVVSVNLDPGQTVECTYTNSKLPAIIVRKITTGIAGGPFTFTTTGGNGFPTTINLTTSAPGVPGAAEQSSLIAAAGIGGTFTVTETALPAGFVLTDVGCVVTTAGAGGTGVSADLALKKATITTLAAGATVTCTFINSGALTTRTQGFWATHLSLVQAVWNPNPATVGTITTDGMTVEERSLCGQVLTVEQVMGGFWANIAKTSTGEKRTPLDQARMRLLQQLLAAILNNQLFGSSPSGNTSIDEAKDAFCDGTLIEVRAAQAAMAAFNESGDSGLFTPGASADPKNARLIADIDFWDVLP
ncbi:MAG TPA: hypothetical protein VGQ02_03635, partial [Candidatus Limnocylindrales bacterium]|nr:hypothetical protein [Candidatus Limnocylindrales bacterium]